MIFDDCRDHDKHMMEKIICLVSVVPDTVFDALDRATQDYVAEAVMDAYWEGWTDREAGTGVLDPAEAHRRIYGVNPT